MIDTIEELLSVNRTAFYTFDTAVLKKRIDYLNSRLPENVKLCYAVKANPFIIREADDKIEKFEICSPGEAIVCKRLKISAEKTVISGVYKTPEFIEELVKDESFCGVFTAESVTQFNQLRDLSEKYNRNIRLLPRLTNDSQFGMNESDIDEIIKNRSEYPLILIEGIQYFSGTQKTSLKKLKREIDNLDSFLLHLRADFGFESKVLEYGGGFFVPYFRSDEFDEEAYLKGFSDILGSMQYKAEIVLELGRSIAASCGKYYTHIVDIKQNKGMNYALVDGGMHHIVYFGQQMAMKHPFLSVVGKSDIDAEKKWAICGSLCSMNDIIVKQVQLPHIEIGDTICFENTGAYCMTEGISLFLTRDIPAVYIIRENGEIICVREPFETYELNTPDYERK